MSFKNISKLKLRYIKLSIGFVIIVFIPIILSQKTNINLLNNYQNDYVEGNEKSFFLKESNSKPNGAPLLIHQYANVSNSQFPNSIPTNASFTLAKGWETKNITINYEGVSYKKDRVYNGEFTNNISGWNFQSNTNLLTGKENTSSEGNPPPSIYIEAAGSNQQYNEGDYGFYYQNFSLDEELSNKLATLSIEYMYNELKGLNASLYMAIQINGEEVNKTVSLNTLVDKTWDSQILQYNPIIEGQNLPGNITIKVGLSINEITSKQGGPLNLYLDNVEFNLWTEPNQPNLAIAYDIMNISSYSNYTYINTSFGKGYSFIDTEYSSNIIEDIKFSIDMNFSSVLDSSIDKITINSILIREFNSTYLGKNGSLYTINDDYITWKTDFQISNPSDYQTYKLEIFKPEDWNLTSIKDSYDEERINSCSGTDFGSNKTIIPESIIQTGLWNIKIKSYNYITNANIGVWNGSSFLNQTELSFSDLFQINCSLNTSVDQKDTQINSTIYYPNGTLFLTESKTINSYNIQIGNYTVGENMIIGTYQVRILWENNQSYLFKNQIGSTEIYFDVNHRSNLTAINPNNEVTQGDPLLLKVNFWDKDVNESISYASVTYNSSYGKNGDMVYQGLGVYIAEIDTSLLDLGEYNYSFTAKKNYYQTQYKNNFIHLKIIAQPLKLEVPKKSLTAIGNNYFSCNINLTGAISHTLLEGPANISTDWIRYYNVTSHNNGMFTINFSTVNLPYYGLTETYSIEIYANKTNYGSTSEFISVTIEPIQTLISVNQSFVEAYINEVFFLKVNFTEEISGGVISNASCSVDWESDTNITYFSNEFIISFSTVGLEKDTHSTLISINKTGYKTSSKSITVSIVEQELTYNVEVNDKIISEDTLLDLYFNKNLDISARVYALGDEEFLSECNLTLMGDAFQYPLVEDPSTYFNISINLDISDFKEGINSVYINFQKANYTSKTFSFQLYLRTQEVNISVSSNGEPINEDTLLDLYFNENLDISARVYALGDDDYVSGGLFTFVSDNFQSNLTESPTTYFNISINLDISDFKEGINYVYINFQKANYTSKTFSFQLYVHKRQANMSVVIDSESISEDFQISRYISQEVNVSIRIIDIVLSEYISDGNLSCKIEDYTYYILESLQMYYNFTISLNKSLLNPGINYIQITFQKESYEDLIFKFQINVKKLEFKSETINFDTSIETKMGQNPVIQIQLLDLVNNIPIENATISYRWSYGIGKMTDLGNGTYQTRISLPSDLTGSFEIKITVSKNSNYETNEFSYFLVISEPPPSNIPFIAITISLVSIIGVSSTILFRTYYYIPRKKAKEKAFQDKIQPFKDAKNILGTNIVQKESGLSLYSQKYSYIKEIDDSLFSGFIHAIMLFGREIGKEKGNVKEKEAKNKVSRLIELDFKYFYILICDYKEIRVLLILREAASNIIKENLIKAVKNIYFEISSFLHDFDGNLVPLRNIIPPILNKHLNLFYKQDFIITEERKYYNKMTQTQMVSTMERRVLTIIEVFLEHHDTFEFSDVFDLISEENEDLIIEALISLVHKKMIIPVEREFQEN